MKGRFEGSDESLLGRFVQQRDDLVFEVLVRRHGPMVLGVCRRVPGYHHDVEDAIEASFAKRQATFQGHQ